MIYTQLNCVKSVPLDIWLVERCVCFWLSCLSGATSSFTVVTFSSLCACISLSDSCSWSVFCVCEILFNNMPSFSFLQFVFENFVSIKNVICIAHPLKVAFLDWYTFLIKALSPLLNGMLHYQYAVTALKINIKNKILCFCLQKLKMYLVLNII